MTPEELEQSRRHAARISDQELADLRARGPEHWPSEAWEILEQEHARRQQAEHNGSRQSRAGDGHGASIGRAFANVDTAFLAKSDLMAGFLGLVLGPVGLWYKRQWVAGLIWLVALSIVATLYGQWVAPFFWLGMAIHAYFAESKH